MHRFDSRRQEDSETIPDFEQALRSLHREAWPTATPEQRDAALKRRFEDGLLSSDMVQFLRLHARDLDFQATAIKARQFADATGQSKPKKRSRAQISEQTGCRALSDYGDQQDTQYPVPSSLGRSNRTSKHDSVVDASSFV